MGAARRHTILMVTLAVDDAPGLLPGLRPAAKTQDRDNLVSSYMPLVRSIVNRFRGSREPLEDLMQIRVVGLLKAIDKFDPGRGVRLASLAIPEVLGAILNHLRDHGSLVKAPRDLRNNRIALARATDMLRACLGRGPTTAELAVECRLSEDDVNENLKFALAADPHSLEATLRPGANDGDSTALEFLGSEDREYEDSLDRITLEAALDGLPLREKTIIALKFYRGMTQRKIAERIGLSQMHVSRLERRALSRLRGLMWDDKTRASVDISEPEFRGSKLPADS
jgi:RNA polymerase sigma-B factor